MEKNPELSKEYEELALKILEANKHIYFINQLCAHMGISRALFYFHDLHELDSIKEALSHNKSERQTALLKNWDMQKDNATMQIALFKLIASPEQRQKLQTQNIDVTTKGEKVGGSYDLSQLTDDELAVLDKLNSKLSNDDTGSQQNTP